MNGIAGMLERIQNLFSFIFIARPLDFESVE